MTPSERNGIVLNAALIIEPRGIASADIVSGFDGGEAVRAELLDRIRAFIEDAGLEGSATWMPGDRIAVEIEGVASRAATEDLARELAAEVEKPLLAGDVPVWVRPHIGMAIAAADMSDRDELLRDATAGAVRNITGPVLVGANERSRFARENTLRSELYAAFDTDELELYLEPVVNAANGSVKSFIAVPRWHHPQRGTLNAETLISEPDDPMTASISLWTVEAVAGWLQNLMSAGVDPLPTAQVAFTVALSSISGIADRIAATLREHGVPPECLIVRMPIEDIYHDAAYETVQQLNAANIAVILTGIGAPGSSLTRLTQSNYEALEIAPGLIASITDEATAAAAVEPVVEVSRAMKTAVHAVGVETEQQREFLRNSGVVAIQGHHISRAIAANRIHDQTDLLRIGENSTAKTAGVPVRTSDDEYVSLSECADALGVSRQTVRRLIDRGELTAERDEKGHRRVRRESLTEFIRARHGVGRLRRRRVPTEPMPLVIEAIDRKGVVIAREAAQSIYEQHNPGWFAEARSAARTRFWVDSLVRNLTTDNLQLLAAETSSFLRDAMLAGARPAEGLRFLEQFTTSVARHLGRGDEERNQLRMFSALMRIAADQFIETL